MKLEITRDRIIRLSREFAWLFTGQVFGILGSFALIRVTTHYLIPEQYGQLSLILTIGVLVCQVSLSGVMPGIMRYYTIAVERRDVSNFTFASFRLMSYGVLGTAGLALVVSVGAYLVGKTAWIGVILLAITFTQISSFNSTLSAIQNAARQRNVVVLHGIIDPWIKIILICIIVFIVGKSVVAILLAYLIAGLILLVSQLFFYRRLTQRTQADRQSFSTPWLQEMVKYSKPYMVFNFFTWVQANSDRWTIERFANAKSVGQYAVLLQLGVAPISMAVSQITNLVGPILQQRSGDATDLSRNRNVWNLTWIITLIGLVLTIFGVLIGAIFHTWLFDFLVDDAYQNQSYLLPWVIFGGGLFATSQILGLKLQSDLNTRALTIPKVVTSIFAVTLNIFCAWIWGVEGVVGAGVIFSFSIFMWMAILTKRPHGVE